MTKAQYDITRRSPQRIEATDTGKEAIRVFVESIMSRDDVEHPKDKQTVGSDEWIMLMYFYFTKYLTERYLEKDKTYNSEIYNITRTRDGKMMCVHNLFSDGKWKSERFKRIKLAQVMAEYCKGKANA